jgi:2-dehydro-3-deoxygalactonokinase
MTWHILGDWGTSRLRLVRIENGTVVDRREGPGIGALTGEVHTVLSETLKGWLDTTAPASIRLCGMAGSRTGLAETGYADCPADVNSWARAGVSLLFQDIPLSIAAGLACVDAHGRHDVIRGEETQIFGALSLEPTLSNGPSLFVLPGTHSKWAWVENGCIISFRTFISGELFALLRDHSTLLKAGDQSPGGKCSRIFGWLGTGAK